MKVPMIIMDWEKCSEAFPKLTKNMLCAGYQNKSFDACQVTKGYPQLHPIDSYHLRAAIAGYRLFIENRQLRVCKMCGIQGSTMEMGT